MEPLRIGVLGAARISELSIIGPAAATGARLVAAPLGTAAAPRPSPDSTGSSGFSTPTRT